MTAVTKDRGGPRVDALYNLMQSFENKLGGGEGVEGLYGSITQASMQKVLDCLKRNSGLDARSAFVDIGAGLGRPMLHAMVAVGLTAAWGVELDPVKCDKAGAFCEHVVKHLVAQEILEETVPLPPVICSPIEKVRTLDPASHAYSFWEGVPPSGKKAFGALFAASKTLRAVAVVQRAIRGQDPAAVMREYGFGPLLFIASFPVKMSGSGRSFQAYVFTKIAPAAANFIANAAAGGATPAPARTLPAVLKEQEEADGAGAATPAGKLSSPSKGRKPDDEAGPASPTKKVAPSRRKGAAVAKEDDDDETATQLRPPVEERPKAKQQQQVLLTSLPEYSRRTKQSAVVSGKPAPGKAAAGKTAAGKEAEVPPAGRTRSSSRLAAKALALAAMSQTTAVEGH